jgi:choline dehydrogenase-like flavoprotein/heme-degrading monooxygenase HmoA
MMSTELNDTQQSVLRALCDTIVPSINVPEDSSGFWSRTASDLGVDKIIAGVITGGVPSALRDALLGLLDILAKQEFVGAQQARREQVLGAVAGSSPQAAAGILFFEKQTLLLTYGLPETPDPVPSAVIFGSPKGQNPNWEVIGYPGPVSIPQPKPKQIQTLVPDGDNVALEADVCVVGSGAGGSVIAARLAMRGCRVIVLEMGGYFNASDFHQLELWSYKHLWYRGGLTPTANGTINLLAGSAVGGGTEINWMNCIRTPAHVRREWACTHGLDGVDSPQFDRYLDDVVQRISANSETAIFNDANLRLREGCQRLGYLTTQTAVNWDPRRFDPLQAGYTGFGDQSGGKQTARRTYLLDACRNGARVMANCRADRILVEQGRAAGVEATYSDSQGRKAKITVRAPQVVVACGSLESPALLLRTGIGGPAVGRYLRLHPTGFVLGVYKEKQKNWWASPQTANCEQFVDTGDGYGFYLEVPAFAPGFYAVAIPWSSGRQHKSLMATFPYVCPFIFLVRDRGHGQVTIDSSGNAVHTYQLTDEIDQKNFRHATAEACRIQQAAGAHQILFSMARKQLIWNRGQDLENFIQTIQQQPLLDGAQPMVSAHQLGSCRMGRDRATSVADTNGELHDVNGVWIGDASAFPTATGANPMVSIMALAERTAEKMAASSRGSVGASPAPQRPLSMVREPARPVTNPTKNLSELAGLIANPANLMGAMFKMMNPANMLTFSERLIRDLGAAGQQQAPRGMRSRSSANLLDPSRPVPNGTASSGVPRTPRPLDARARLQTTAMPAGGGAPPPPSHQGCPMYSQIQEVNAKPGLATEMADVMRNVVIPQYQKPSEGFIDAIVLLSDTEPNHVSVVSFWRSKADADRFIATSFVKASAVLMPYVTAPPERREFSVRA